MKPYIIAITPERNRRMTKEEIEYHTIAHLVSVLAVMYAANPEKIIDLLAAYLFIEEEARDIKEILKDISQ